MLISYYADKKSSPRLPSWQPSLISFNTPIDSGSIIKPCTLKHFQVPILAPGLLGYSPKLITLEKGHCIDIVPMKHLIIFPRINYVRKGPLYWYCVNEGSYEPDDYMSYLEGDYHKTSNISRIKSKNLTVSCLALQLSLPIPLKPGVNSLRPSDAYMRQWTNHHWFR